MAKNSLTLNEVQYLSFESDNARNVLLSPTSTQALRDQITLGRELPKASGNFRGVRKIQLKITRDVVVTDSLGNDIVAPLIATVQFAVPVGTDPSKVAILRTDIAALTADDEVTDTIERSFI